MNEGQRLIPFSGPELDPDGESGVLLSRLTGEIVPPEYIAAITVWQDRNTEQTVPLTLRQLKALRNAADRLIAIME